jgi:pimeloyl-ACP methyl ester carboxylesterase
VVTFGHGTTGVNDTCAPSRSDPPFAGIAGTLDLVKAGYVVTATDYPGLGTPGDHPIYMAEYAGRAVLDAARAARHLPAAGAGAEVVVWGYSQGGQAALAAGSLAVSYAPDLDVRGVVATAPLADLPASLARLQRNGDGTAYLLLAAMGLATVDPSVDLKAVLTPTGRRLALAAERNCAIALTTASQGETIETVFTENPLTAEPFASGFARQRDAVLGPMAPILILQGDLDNVIDQPTTDGLVSELCTAGNLVDYRRYTIADHGSIHVASIGHLATWVNERFNNLPSWNICTGRIAGGGA